MPTPSRSLSTAVDRRSTVEAAAVTAFADRGYYGTTTAEVATEAGISQAYLYKLYPDKTAIFAAALEHVSNRLAEAYRQGFEQHGATPDTLRAVSRRLAGDRPLIRLLMHAGCAAAVPEIADAVRRCYAKQYEVFRTSGGIDDESARRYFADSLLANVMDTIAAGDVDADWARALAPAQN